MTKEERELLKEAIRIYGIDAQEGMLYEEMGELMSAINKLKRRRVDKNVVIEEIADVQIILNQITIFFGEHEVNAVKKKKLARLKERLGRAVVQYNT